MRKFKIILLTALQLIIISSVLFAGENAKENQEIFKGTNSKMLMEIKDNIAKYLSDSSIKIEMSYENPYYYFKNNTMIFNVHIKDNRTGLYEKELAQREGPNANGLIVSFRYQEGEYMEPLACTPGQPMKFNNEYWTSIFSIYYLNPSKNYIAVWISYGRKIDKKIIDGLCDIFKSISEKNIEK